MKESAEVAWSGERSRPLNAYRPCPCGVCSKGRKGVGYLSFSNANGRGFTVWLEDETVFRRLRRALRQLRQNHPGNRRRYVAQGNRPVCRVHFPTLKGELRLPPKPKRSELFKQVRRATIDDQLHLLRWLETKFEKIKPEKK
jgi:hypothetical protein